MSPLSNKIVLLNAPKGAGKDTVGECLRLMFGCSLRSFKTALYDCTYPFTDCKDMAEFIKHCTDRSLKEKPSPLFHGMSPREALIYVSEKMTKPHFGQEFFGRKSALSISSDDFDKGVVFTDSGFAEEVFPLMKEFGGKNIYVVQFSGQGSNNFAGDSREFIQVDGVHTIRMDVRNENIVPGEFAHLIIQEIAKYG